ncbi:metallopeptidase family protein [Candidatus Saccharibacteria bacterium]|nr:metallopeptidase family protein [Candidatus Saccharibacteria bacterium]
MKTVTDEDFSKLIGEALDQLPEKYTSKLSNVVITYDDQPSDEQRKRLKLHCNQSLFGLYEGIPLTRRGNGFSGQLPDKITLFKLPLLFNSTDEDDFKKQIKHTLWHEIAHYFGLDHDRIHELENKRALQE